MTSLAELARITKEFDTPITSTVLHALQNHLYDARERGVDDQITETAVATLAQLTNGEMTTLDPLEAEAALRNWLRTELGEPSGEQLNAMLAGMTPEIRRLIDVYRS